MGDFESKIMKRLRAKQVVAENKSVTSSQQLSVNYLKQSKYEFTAYKNPDDD